MDAKKRNLYVLAYTAHSKNKHGRSPVTIRMPSVSGGHAGGQINTAVQ